MKSHQHYEFHPSAPATIGAAGTVINLRTPPLEGILRDTAVSPRLSMTGIYVRSRAASLVSDFDMIFDPEYDYTEFVPRPISPTCLQETLASVGLSTHKQPSSTSSSSTSSSSSSSTLVATSPPMRPVRHSRPFPQPTGPPLGYSVVDDSEADAVGDDEEIVYLLEDYSARHTITVSDKIEQLKSTIQEDEDARNLAPSIRGLSGSTTESPRPVAGRTLRHAKDKVGALNLEKHAKVLYGSVPALPQDAPMITPFPIVNPNSPPLPSAITSNATSIEPPQPAPRATTVKSVTFAPDVVNNRAPRTSSAKISTAVVSFTNGVGPTPKIPTKDVVSPPKVFETDAPALVGACSCGIHCHIPVEAKVAFPNVELTSATINGLERVSPDAEISSLKFDTASIKSAKKKRSHFGVYKVLRRALKLGNGTDHKVQASIDGPSIASTITGKPNVLRKPDPATKAKSSSASMYNMPVSSSASQKTPRMSFGKKTFSIRSGKSARKRVDSNSLNATPQAHSALSSAPSPRTGHRHRSASFSGFANVATSAWEDPVEMDELLKEATRLLAQNPHNGWVYKAKAEQVPDAEEALAAGFVLERHVRA